MEGEENLDIFGKKTPLEKIFFFSRWFNELELEVIASEIISGLSQPLESQVASLRVAFFF